MDGWPNAPGWVDAYARAEDWKPGMVADSAEWFADWEIDAEFSNGGIDFVYARRRGGGVVFARWAADMPMPMWATLYALATRVHESPFRQHPSREG